MTQQLSAAARCEEFLRKEHACNVDHNIWPSANRLIDRMLARGAELHALYEEVWDELEPEAVEQFLSIILDVGANWHPIYLNGARQARCRQVELRSEISELANKLAVRLRERTELDEGSGFRTNGAYHIVDLIERANESNWHFNLFLRRRFSALRHQYDLKFSMI